MHLNQLKRFVVVAECGNLRRAATQLHLTQPALTQSVHALERELGAPVFHRSTRGVSLTEFGRTLMPRARFMLNERDLIASDLEQIRGRKAMQLRIGVGPYFTRHLFPAAAARTLEKLPQVQLQIVDAHSTELANLLAMGSIDLAFCVHNPRLNDAVELQFEDIFTERYCVMARSDHPLFKRTRIRERDLAHFAWIVLDAEATATLLMRSFEERRLPAPRWSASTLSLSAMLGLLIKSDLLALVPQDFAQPDLDAGRLRRVTGHSLEVNGRAGLLTRKDSVPNIAIEQFKKNLRAACAEVYAKPVLAPR